MRKVTEYPVDLIKDIELQKCDIQNLQMTLRVSKHLESMIRQKEKELKNSLIKKKILKFIPVIAILIVIMVIAFVAVNNRKPLPTNESVAVESNDDEVDEDKYNVYLKQKKENTPLRFMPRRINFPETVRPNDYHTAFSNHRFQKSAPYPADNFMFEISRKADAITHVQAS